MFYINKKIFTEFVCLIILAGKFPILVQQSKIMNSLHGQQKQILVSLIRKSFLSRLKQIISLSVESMTFEEVKRLKSHLIGKHLMNFFELNECPSFFKPL